MGLFSSPEKDAAKKEQQQKVQEIRKKHHLDKVRFYQTYDHDGIRILLDTVTGVNYLYIFRSKWAKSSDGPSISNTITPLLDASGKPVIYTREEIDEFLNN